MLKYNMILLLIFVIIFSGCNYNVKLDDKIQIDPFKLIERDSVCGIINNLFINKVFNDKDYIPLDLSNIVKVSLYSMGNNQEFSFNDLQKLYLSLSHREMDSIESISFHNNNSVIYLNSNSKIEYPFTNGRQIMVWIRIIYLNNKFDSAIVNFRYSINFEQGESFLYLLKSDNEKWVIENSRRLFII